MNIAGPENIEDFVRRFIQRFAELKPLEVGPPDRRLARFERDRYSVVGRPDERPEGDTGIAVDTGFNIGYIRCDSGKGHCSHSHPDFEVFIPMFGRWRISIEGIGDVIAEPWDVIAVPPRIVSFDRECERRRRLHDVRECGEYDGGFQNSARNTSRAGCAARVIRHKTNASYSRLGLAGFVRGVQSAQRKCLSARRNLVP